MKVALPVLGLVFLVVVVFISDRSFAPRGLGGSFFSPTEEGMRPPAISALSAAAAMLLGIFSGCVHSQLRDRSGEVEIGKEVRLAFKRPELWKSLFASPVVFAAVYSAINDRPDLVMVILFAFENGFFCNKVLEQKGST